MLFDFLDKESLDDLVGPFMRMVDDLTPYYQYRMRRLPPAQRKIVEFLCLESRPRLIKEIAASLPHVPSDSRKTNRRTCYGWYLSAASAQDAIPIANSPNR